MKIDALVEYTDLKLFEEKIGGNVKIGGYDMDKCCPIVEGQCYKITLEESDIERLCLLRESSFTELTHNQNYRLSGLLYDKANQLNNVKYWLDKKLDLTASQEWSPVFVTKHLDDGLIVTIDGNHRLMAHFLIHHKIDGLKGFIFVHSEIVQWGFMPSEK